MKYSDVVKAMLIASINDLAADPEKYAVNPGKDFSRNRKLGFTQLVHMLLCTPGKVQAAHEFLLPKLVKNSF